MKNLIWIAIGIILTLLVVMSVLYVFAILKVRNTNSKIYKYKKEELLKEKNVLVIYQPSTHHTTQKIVEIIKNVLNDTDYGYLIHTLDKNPEDYKSYEKVILVVPVYFSSIHKEFLNILKSSRIDNLIIIYNGLNKENNDEDKEVKNYVKKYSKIKTHTEDIELLDEFIKREMGLWKK